MKRWRFPVALAVFVSALFTPSAYALWSDYVFVSSTLGINTNRLCVGDGSRGDIGCPTYAPTVSSGGLLTAVNISATNVSVSNVLTAPSAIFSSLLTDAAGLGQVAMTSATVTGDFRVWGNLYVSGSQTIDGVSFANGGVNAVGTVTATAFSGDGSRLTNLNTGGFDDDRIISSTSGVIANGVANGGYISLTNGGATTWGYLGTSASYLPTLTVGAISATTNQASFTTVHAGRILTGSGASGTSNLAYSFLSDTDTGLYNSATNRLTVQTNARDRMIINELGQAGFSTAGPPSSGSASFTSSNFGSSLLVASLRDPANAFLVAGNNASEMLRMWVDDSSSYIQTGQDEVNGGASLNILLGNQSGQTPAFGVYNRTSGASVQLMKLNNEGRMIVGAAATPSATLHVSGNILTTSWTGINFSSAANVTPTAPLEVSGTVSATRFVGDGSGLTGMASGDRIVSGTAQIIARSNADISVSTNMDVSGTIKLAGTGSEVCSAATIGTTRVNPATGRPEYCRW